MISLTYPLFILPVLLSMMLNERNIKAVYERHQHTGTPTCGQIHTTASSQAQSRLMQQIDRYNRDNRDGEIQSSNQGLIVVNGHQGEVL